MKTLNYNSFACFGKGDYSDLIEGCIKITDDVWERIRAFHDEHPDACALDDGKFRNVYTACYEDVLEKMADHYLSYDPESILDYLEEARRNFDRDSHKLSLEDAKEYLENNAEITIRET